MMILSEHARTAADADVWRRLLSIRQHVDAAKALAVQAHPQRRPGA
jgi:hypothetical protein